MSHSFLKEKKIFVISLSFLFVISVVLSVYHIFIEPFSAFSSEYTIGTCHVYPEQLTCTKKESEPMIDAKSALLGVCTTEARAEDACGEFVGCSATGQVIKLPQFQECLNCIFPKTNTARIMCGVRFPGLQAFIWH